jgi:3,4-dihydroxy 2-butanone 4-phosphate synthase/GTP cyclohydrolase II
MARLAGLSPAAVVCEIMNEDGTMARLPQLEVFAERHNLKIISVADLVRYRFQKESLIRKVIETDLPTDYGDFRAIIYENVINGETHVAFVLGDVSDATKTIPVRVQTENITFAMFGSRLGEAALAINSSLKKISEAGKGVILYLRQREHNLDLIHQLETYAVMQENDLDFQEAKKETGYGKFRDYGIGAQILNDLGVRKLRLLTNHPPQVNALDAFNLEIVEVESLLRKISESSEARPSTIGFVILPVMFPLKTKFPANST